MPWIRSLERSIQWRKREREREMGEHQIEEDEWGEAAGLGVDWGLDCEGGGGGEGGREVIT